MNKTIISIAIAAGFAGCCIVPALAGTVGIAAQASIPGTVTVSDFAPKREHKLVSDAEAVAFSGHIGRIEATCGGEKIAITPADEAERIPVLDGQIYKACPGRDLSVTITTTN